MLQRPGSSWGFGALLKDTSVVVLKEDTPPTNNPCRTWDLNPQPSAYKSDSLSIRPRLFPAAWVAAPPSTLARDFITWEFGGIAASLLAAIPQVCRRSRHTQPRRSQGDRRRRPRLTLSCRSRGKACRRPRLQSQVHDPSFPGGEDGRIDMDAC